MGKEEVMSQVLVLLNCYAPDDMTLAEVREFSEIIAIIIANPRLLRKDWKRKDAREQQQAATVAAAKTGQPRTRRTRR